MIYGLGDQEIEIDNMNVDLKLFGVIMAIIYFFATSYLCYKWAKNKKMTFLDTFKEPRSPLSIFRDLLKSEREKRNKKNNPSNSKLEEKSPPAPQIAQGDEKNNDSVQIARDNFPITKNEEGTRKNPETSSQNPE